MLKVNVETFLQREQEYIVKTEPCGVCGKTLYWVKYDGLPIDAEHEYRCSQCIGHDAFKCDKYLCQDCDDTHVRCFECTVGAIVASNNERDNWLDRQRLPKVMARRGINAT